MTTQILALAQLPPPLQAGIEQLGEVTALPTGAERDVFLAENGDRYTVAVTHAGVGASAELISRLPQLQAICSLGVGYDSIDIKTAAQRGIVASNTPDVLNDCVADLTMGLLIDVARGVSAGDRYVRRGDWVAKGPPALAARVSGKRLGILGMGRIGRVIAQRATAFAMDIRYHSRTPKSDVSWGYEESLDGLAGWADFLVIACTGGAATRNLVSASTLAALGSGGRLVNIARGTVVDENALVQALQQDTIAGAALDVHAQEPQVAAALLELDNVVLTPHIGSATEETRRAMADLVVENVRSFVASGQLRTPCT